MEKGMILINGIQIPMIIKSYKTSKSVKIFVKNNVVVITRPPFVSKAQLKGLINKNKDKIYFEFTHYKNEITKCWKTGEEILFQGEKYQIIRDYIPENKVKIKIDDQQQLIDIFVPKEIDEEMLKNTIDKLFKKILKSHTEKIISIRLPYLSQVTKISYNSVQVRDAISKYGSCVPSKKALHFSARLAMLKPEIIDAIIVHELCHIVYRNHSQQFYDLVKKYIPNYDEVNEWLKKNNKAIMF